MWAEAHDGIVTRLRAKCAPSVHIQTADELAHVVEARNKAPAIRVLYEGYDIGANTSGVPHRLQLDLLFLVVAVGQSAIGSGNARAAAVQTSDLAIEICRWLLGYSPCESNRARRLELRRGTSPVFDGGMCYLPMSFALPSTVVGEPNA